MKEFDSIIHDRLQLDTVRRARYFAIEAHKNQPYDDKPYYHHILYVEKVLKAFGFYEEDLLVSGMLHDAVEDCDITLEEVTEKFGEVVSKIVWRVTDLSNEELIRLNLKPNRKNRKLHTYPKTRECKRAIIVKLADRIANVEYGILSKNIKKGLMYKNEQPEFKRALYFEHHGFRIQNMWAHLDGIINLITN